MTERNIITNLFKSEKKKQSLLTKDKIDINEKKLKETVEECFKISTQKDKKEEGFTKAKQKRISHVKLDLPDEKNQIKISSLFENLKRKANNPAQTLESNSKEIQQETSKVNDNPNKIVQGNEKVVLSDKTQSILSKITQSKNTIKTDSKPQVSDKTLLLIERLKTERNKKLDSIKTSINYDSAVSLRFKYNELVQEKRQLLLPVVCKKLLLCFQELDSMLNFFKVKKKTPYFTEISSNLLQLKKRQILFIVPHFFIYQWESKGNDYTLIIDFPIDIEERMQRDYNETEDFISMQTEKYTPYEGELSYDVLNRRKEQFKAIIYSYINSLHSEYLCKNSIDQFDPFIHNTWHSGFEISQINSLPFFYMKEKPSSQVTTLRELKKEVHANNLVNEALELIAKKDDSLKEKQEIKKSALPNEENNLKSLLSNDLYQKIKNKEKQRENSSKNLMKIKQLKEIAFSIKDAFVCKGVSSMKAEDLHYTIEKKTGLERDFIINTLKEFTVNQSDFIKLYEMNSLSFVKIDGSYAMETLINSIDNQFK